MNPAEVILREVPILTRADAPTAIDTPILKYGDWQRFHAAEENGQIRWEQWERGSLYLFASAGLRYLHHGPIIPDVNLDWSLTEQEVRVRLDAWPKNDIAQQAQEALKTGEIKGLSIEFVPLSVRSEGRGKVIERALINGVALVIKPAYDYATVTRGDDLKQTVLRRII